MGVHRIRRVIFGAVTIMIGAGAAFAQSPIRDLYVEAAVIAEKCGEPALDRAGEAKLAAVIAAETKEQTTASDVAELLAKARAAHAGAVDCKGPFASIHVLFFRNVVLPRMAGEGNASPFPA